MKAKLNESLGIPAGKQKLQYEVKWGQIYIRSEVLNFLKFKKKICVNFDIYFLSIICEKFNYFVFLKILYSWKLFLCWNLLWRMTAHLSVFLINNCLEMHYHYQIVLLRFYRVYSWRTRTASPTTMWLRVVPSPYSWRREEEGRSRQRRWQTVPFS